MRPGRAEDLTPLIELWRREVAAGRQDMVPEETRMRRMLSRFDWEARSRMVDDGGRLGGAILLMSRPSPDGIIASLYVAGPDPIAAELARWGLGLSRAAGAAVTQTFMAKGQGGGLREAGMEVVRPWWRMDRGLLGDLPTPARVAGYDLVDGSRVPPDSWADMFNRTFADHWRFAPRGDEEVLAGKPPGLCLMAVATTGRAPSAIAFGELERYADDPRPQPVGLISSVGTLPDHRRRGLAGWLVAELMRRLAHKGARCASLYVDGLNPTRAYDVYRRLGFEVTFEAEVWEATFT
jgi:ribosomal protein S18 acetylase RimI-like enzyme